MKLKSFFDQYGFSAIPRGVKVVLRKFGIITETFFLLKYTIDEKKINDLYDVLNFSDVTELTIKDIGRITFLSDEKLNLFKSRFQNGSYSCFAIIINKEIEYLTWISWKKMNYPTFFDKSEPLKPSQALLEDSFCSPKHRGKGYHSKMNIFRLKQILDKNKTEVLALVLKENKPAIKVQLKSGFSYDLRIRFIKIGSWNRTFQKMMK